MSPPTILTTPLPNHRGFIALLTFGICCRSALRFNCHTNPTIAQRTQPSSSPNPKLDDLLLLLFLPYSFLISVYFLSCGFFAWLTFGSCCRSALRFNCSSLLLTHYSPPLAPLTQLLLHSHYYRGFIALLTFGICCRSVLRFNCLPNPKPRTADTTTLHYWTNYITQLGKPTNHHSYTQPTCNSTHKLRIHCSTDLRHLLSVGFAI